MDKEENIFSYYIKRIEQLQYGGGNFEQTELCREIVNLLRNLNVSEAYVTDFLNVKFAIPGGIWDLGESMRDFEYGKSRWIEILNTINEALQYKIPVLKGNAQGKAIRRSRRLSSGGIIPKSIFKKCPSYIKRIVEEINGTYKGGYFTASAVMMRRLVETCMIEAFERKGLADRIKNGEDYKTADGIKNELLKNPFGNLPRNERKVLNKSSFLRLGDLCAHNRFFFSEKENLDKLRDDIEVLIQYLICQFM